MKPSLTRLILLVTAHHAIASPVHNSSSGLLIRNDVFAVQGASWPNNSDVNFWGNIPYAEPPLGSLRFRPPVTKSPDPDTVINGTWFGPSCIQYSSGSPTVYTDYLTGFTLSPGQTQDEDCLTVNVWAPKGAKRGDKLPVMIWIHGGGHTSGGAASPYKYGDRLAANQNVIVVAMNYRLNIFGYPGAAALDGRNLNPGLLDQRKAVEWTYQNIYSFGGNPELMTLFGQSAGGQSVDYYNYAYPNDPIVAGFIAQSGVASNGGAPDPTGSNFTFVASSVGCGNLTDKDAVFECMQRADATALIEVYNGYNATLNGGRSLSFQTRADNQTRFSNYTDLQNRGLFARVPTIYSSTNNEGSSLLSYNPAGVNQTAVDAFTLSFTTCPGATASVARANYDVPVWRLRYFGVWPNLNPLSWLGAYHSSDMPMIFGTSDLRGPDTAEEAALSRYWQTAWATFAKDPARGLVDYGWPTYNPDARTLVQLGLNGTTTAVLNDGDAFDGAC